MIDANDDASGALAYPHFRRFYAHRSDTAVVALLEDPRARAALFHGDDQSLADALRALGSGGLEEFFWVSGWDGFADRRIQRLLDEHPDRQV